MEFHINTASFNRGEEMVQWIEHLSYKTEDQSLDPHNPQKSKSQVGKTAICYPVLKKAEIGLGRWLCG